MRKQRIMGNMRDAVDVRICWNSKIEKGGKWKKGEKMSPKIRNMRSALDVGLWATLTVTTFLIYFHCEHHSPNSSHHSNFWTLSYIPPNFCDKKYQIISNWIADMYISKCVATGFTRQKSNPDKNSVVVELQFKMDEWILMQSIAILTS